MQLGSDAETIRWAASRHCRKENAAKITSRLVRFLALYPSDGLNTGDEPQSHENGLGTCNLTAGKGGKQLSDREKKFIPAKNSRSSRLHALCSTTNSHGSAKSLGLIWLQCQLSTMFPGGKNSG